MSSFLNLIKEGSVTIDKVDGELNKAQSSLKGAIKFAKRGDMSDVASSISEISLDIDKLRDTFTGMNESPVGQKGRTSITDADVYIDENPQIVAEFKKIIKKMGGKAVARRVLDRVSFAKTITEATETAEDYIRKAGYKVRKVHTLKNGKEIEFYKASSSEEAMEDLKSAGFLEDYEMIHDGYKSIKITEK